MREIPLMHRIMLRCSAGATRLFRVNSGKAWQGRGQAEVARKVMQVTVYPGDVVLRQAQPLEMGLTTGGSDLIGWTQHDGLGIFTALEVKTETGRIRPEQQVFIDQVRAAGGIAGIVRSEDEAVELLKKR